MNKTWKRNLMMAAMASAFGAGAALPAWAQSDVSSSTSGASSTSQSSRASGQASKQAQQSGHDMRASELMGKEVRNAKGEDLGEIQDLFVDVGAQRVQYAVLSFGGFLGLGDKLFAYPVSAFQPSSDGDQLVLNVDQKKLKSAPGFERDKWPDSADNRYFSDVDRFFGESGSRTTQATHDMMRASELIGRDVNDRTGDEVGEIEDMVVGLGKGKISYVVMEFDREWNPDDKLLPLPLTAFSFPKERGEELVLRVARNNLDLTTGFDEHQWPDFNTASFRQRMNAYFQNLDRTMSAEDRSTERTTSTGSSQ